MISIVPYLFTAVLMLSTPFSEISTRRTSKLI